MPFDYQTVKEWPFEPVRQTVREQDAILYALSVGYGFDPLDRRQLRYVYEDDLVAPPSFATVLGHPGFWMRDPATGIAWKKVVHAEQGLLLHSRLPVSGIVVGQTRVRAIVDKGPEKGAIVYQERRLTDGTGNLLATLEQTSFCRGDGGLAASDEAPPSAGPALPEDPPDATCDLATLRQSALLHRLCGDTNPLHADPAVAAAAGFERPILHGLCTYGVAAHAILRTWCDYDPDALVSLAVRFSAPAYPGETIRTEMWRREDTILFRARGLERDTVVLTKGVATLRS